MNSKTYEQMLNDPELSHLLGQTLLRDDLLTEILGDEAHEILYWAGKRLGRNYRLKSVDDIINFFAQFGFGNLALTKESKNQMDFEITGEIIKTRLSNDADADFQLECGLIAQLVEFISNKQSEAENIKRNIKKGIITIRVSSSDEQPIDAIIPDDFFEIKHADAADTE
ncbi:YslB family protein [Lentilactobacillus sp. SPB1-3]|uniref:YslB family protein n=1 Tax=Lentilactobacillus terminaliae TaxID=3003483 RepID=A0ACD5DCW4_9LACO|nr:YslB family protein [Lentilactobacillus sp. SPB1-3]MCZ0977357.1 YslB family protein [Lentilactobacillus sp. SPB1-3]